MASHRTEDPPGSTPEPASARPATAADFADLYKLQQQTHTIATFALMCSMAAAGASGYMLWKVLQHASTIRDAFANYP